MDEIEFPAEDGKAVVVCDDREMRGKAVLRLFELGAVLKPLRLQSGDFLCSSRVCVERKSANDFESSIVDGRLFAQAGEFSKQYASPILAIVGTDFPRIHANAVRGAVLSLCTDFRIPVLFVDDENGLADLLYALAQREQLRNKGPQQLRFQKPSLSPEQSMQFIIESLPGIGPKTALELLRDFGTVENVFTAEAEELQRVDGIGPLKAEEIRSLLSKRFQKA